MKNTGGNILITDDSLILRHVTEQQQGNYRCVAKNQVGTGASNVIELAVKCKSTSQVLHATCFPMVKAHFREDWLPMIRAPWTGLLMNPLTAAYRTLRRSNHNEGREQLQIVNRLVI